MSYNLKNQPYAKLKGEKLSYRELEKENAKLKANQAGVCEFLKKLKQQANQTIEKPLFSRDSLNDWLSTYIKKLEGGQDE